MKRSFATFAILVSLTVLAVGLADAQGLPKLRLASGGEKGTYYAMANNAAAYCGRGLLLEVQKTGGSDDNIERLIGNKADIAIVQKDILFKRAKINNDPAVKNFLAVMPLHYEAMHLVVLEKSGITKFSELGSKKGGWFGGSNAARKVAAYGGSIESAEIVRAMSEVDLEIVVVENQPAALAALNGGQVEAILAMGGTPLGWIDDLKRGQHRLVPFDVSVEKVSGAYKRANVTYTKLGANAVPTIATDAVLITRNFTTREKVEAVSLLRACVWTELTRLQEEEGNHGQWQNVEKDKQVDGWSWFAGMKVQWPPTGQKK